MAATSGKAAWDKYYNGKLPLTTMFNGTKCGPLYSAVDGKSVSDRAIGGTLVEVLDQKWTDDAKKTILIRIKDTKKEYRVNIDHLIKPKTGSRTITNKALSPKGLNLTVGSNVIKKSEYIRKVTAAVKAISTDIIDDNIKDLCITFTKTDGTERAMQCTLVEGRIPSDKIPKKTGGVPNTSAARVFDTEKSEWRSFRWDSVIKVEFK